jgi:hypothetical protein
MKKIITISMVAMMFLVNVSVVMADGTTQVEKVCTTNQYGETTCSEKTTRSEIVHQPVAAALGDVNMGLISIGLLGGAGVAYYISRKVSQI